MECQTGETVDGDYCQSLEKAELVREGTDCTILCYGRMRHVAMHAVESLEQQGFDPEVSARPAQIPSGLARHAHWQSCLLAVLCSLTGWKIAVLVHVLETCQQHTTEHEATGC